MASPALLPSPTSAKSDLTRQSSTYSTTNRDQVIDQNDKFRTMDDYINNIYGDHPTPLSHDCDDRKMRNGEEHTFHEITLEEFLFKAGVVTIEDMKVPEMVGVGAFAVDQQQGEGSSSGSSFWLGNGDGDGRKGKRRAVMEPIDRLAQQKQKRMIKNRESAARSRERKQAYTKELESLLSQLEEENSVLLREQAARKRERYKQLMENLIPVLEKRKPQSWGVLSRSHSAHW